MLPVIYKEIFKRITPSFSVFLKQVYFERSVSHECRHKFLDTAELCTEEIHSILWSSFDIKAHMKNNLRFEKALKGKKVTILCSCQNNFCANFIVQSAIKSLGADLRIVTATKWESSKFKKDIGRMYSMFSDAILVQGHSHLSVCELTDGASVPVVNIASHKFAPLQGLAVLMTMQEHLDRLSGLTLGWVGPMGNKLNTLIYLLPKVGVNLRYNSCPRPNFPASPLILPTGRALCDTHKTKIEAFSDPVETLSGVDVVGTSKHRTDTISIDLKMLEKANSNWVFLHLLPRWEGDVDEEVFHHEKSLVWALHENIQFITMAVMLSLFQKYKPLTPKPNFGSI